MDIFTLSDKTIHSIHKNDKIYYRIFRDSEDVKYEHFAQCYCGKSRQIPVFMISMESETPKWLQKLDVFWE
jgi:hypothetical protein